MEFVRILVYQSLDFCITLCYISGMNRKHTNITYDKRQTDELFGGNIRKDSTIILRVTDDLRGQIERAAKAQGMTLSQAVRFILSIYFTQEYRNERQRAGAETPDNDDQEAGPSSQFLNRVTESGERKLQSEHRGNHLSISSSERKS